MLYREEKTLKKQLLLEFGSERIFDSQKQWVFRLKSMNPKANVNFGKIVHEGYNKIRTKRTFYVPTSTVSKYRII